MMGWFGHRCDFGEPEPFDDLGMVAPDRTPLRPQDSVLMSPALQDGAFSTGDATFDAISSRFQAKLNTPPLFYISNCRSKRCKRTFIYKRRNLTSGGFVLEPADARTARSAETRRTS